MTEKDTKEAFALAEKELKEKQIQEVKETVNTRANFNKKFWEELFRVKVQNG